MAGGVRTQKLPQLVKHYREGAGLKQNELGRLLGHKDGSQVSAWEAGDKVPTLETTLEMAAQFGVTASQLVGEVERPQPGAPVTNNIVNGSHQTVYNHVEGLPLMTEAFEERLRKVVEEVVDARCERLVQELRVMLREAARDADTDAGQGEDR